jgi:hypothetical protein
MSCGPYVRSGPPGSASRVTVGLRARRLCGDWLVGRAAVLLLARDGGLRRRSRMSVWSGTAALASRISLWDRAHCGGPRSAPSCRRFPLLPPGGHAAHRNSYPCKRTEHISHAERVALIWSCLGYFGNARNALLAEVRRASRRWMTSANVTTKSLLSMRSIVRAGSWQVRQAAPATKRLGPGRLHAMHSGIVRSSPARSGPRRSERYVSLMSSCWVYRNPRS